MSEKTPSTPQCSGFTRSYPCDRPSRYIVGLEDGFSSWPTCRVHMSQRVAWVADGFSVRATVEKVTRDGS